ncbi:NAD(P)/FAD-dependent oxidoreductase [Mycolicibacterium doricum]|uniref:Pyridine nucleotide-disulfide oxidoreductase n=1 Tax=Mycolicibacterium doricum TaxID=126673 RepID=A0A1X1SXY5_9MYCO|nr:FAD/NAD(P)-binding oxidoreductase [Mycolicibacterium doricum]ORV36040.1 pyridine nucleotide-disulfide oxidoreductase [Mycolicibacterium doricum]
MSAVRHQIVVVGGGNAGVSLAARLRRAGMIDIGIVEPSDTHYYQPLWTLVGGGCVKATASARPQASVMPQGVGWIKDHACEIDPEKQRVSTEGGITVGYDHLVVCPGIQLDWTAVPGMAESLDSPAVSSNYRYDLAPKTWELIRSMRSGTAIFTMPSGPIKCAGAPQKIAYLAADYWRRQGVLSKIRIVMVLPTPGMFGVKEFSDELERVVARYGIEVRFNSEVTTVNPDTRTVTVTDNAAQTTTEVGYDLLHVVPRQSAPDWIKAGPLAAPDNPGGYVDVDKHTMRHNAFDNIFALGDAGSTPNSKTGAAIRKQAPVVAANLADSMAGRPLSASYGGYASCPLTTARDKMLLAEFDYTMRPAPSIPFIDTTHERRDMWLLKRYGLPAMYWNLILKGRA